MNDNKTETQMSDSLQGLVNEMSGLGGANDKARGGEWHFNRTHATKLENAYRSNWMSRKAVDIPAFDMLREGWTWQCNKEEVEKIEAEEKRVGIQVKVLEALTAARLFGGAAIVISDGAGDPSKELRFETMQQGALKFIAVVGIDVLISGAINRDPLSEFYLEPIEYTLNADSRGSVRIHPSRVIRFIGAPIPRSYRATIDPWGDSVLEAIDIAIKNAASAEGGIATLIQEAKTDVFKIPSLTEKVSSKNYRQSLIDRFSLAQRAKSMVNALLIDAKEEYAQKQISFADLPDVQRLFLQIVSGAADIPITRFLNQSPSGLSSTGESDLRNYYDRIASEQELRLRPPLQRLLNFVVMSALGQMPDSAYFKFDPLWQMSDIDKATVAKSHAETAEKNVNAGLVPVEVQAEAYKNLMIETGTYPGIDEAYDKWTAAGGDFALEAEEKRAAEEAAAAAQTAALEVETQPKPKKPDLKVVGDATPRSLYVRRELKNSKEFIAWAKKQGFKTTLPADEMHVTLIYSRAKVDWMEVSSSWNEDLTIPAGGARIVEPLGSAGAIVLLFQSNELKWRHEQIVEAGAFSEFDSFQPHVTITYSGEGVDLLQVEPYMGELVFGPEIFEEVKSNWAETITEDGGVIHFQRALDARLEQRDRDFLAGIKEALKP